MLFVNDVVLFYDDFVLLLVLLLVYFSFIVEINSDLLIIDNIFL